MGPICADPKADIVFKLIVGAEAHEPLLAMAGQRASRSRRSQGSSAGLVRLVHDAAKWVEDPAASMVATRERTEAS